MAARRRRSGARRGARRAEASASVRGCQAGLTRRSRSALQPAIYRDGGGAMDRWRAAGALLALAACIASSAAAPTASNHTALDLYDGAPEGCYYNFQHYGEGDRIMTNEPCLNCTCHNRMLMCYLRVCPFTKPIGQDCTVEKRADQCCPIVTCPDVPVDLLTSTSTNSPAEYGATALGKLDKYGCSINGKYFSEGSKVPPMPNKPCEHCYCIRNMTTCVMQECTLHVDGCTPIYHKDVCCPVRYSCDHQEDEIPLLDDMTTTVRPTPGFLLTTTTVSPVTQISQDCVHDDQVFPDGALIRTEKACEHCYCMKGDIVCVVQECGTPMENEGKNCTSLAPREGQCCPDTYICEGDELSTELSSEITTEQVLEDRTTVSPPRRVAEGSGYRNEPDDTAHIEVSSTESEMEGSGEDLSINDIITLEKQTTIIPDESLLTTEIESISTSTKTSLIEEIEEGTPAIDFTKLHDISTEGILKEDTTDKNIPRTTVAPRLEEIEKSTAEPDEIYGTISEKESSELDQLIPVATTASILEHPVKETTEIYETTDTTSNPEDEDKNVIDKLSLTSSAPATELDEGQHFKPDDISEKESSAPEEFTPVTTIRSIIDQTESLPDRQTEDAVPERDIPKHDVLTTNIFDESDIYTTETSQDQDMISSYGTETEGTEPEPLIPITTTGPKTEEGTQSNIVPDVTIDKESSDLEQFIQISTSAPNYADSVKTTSEPITDIYDSPTSNIPLFEETTHESIEEQDLTPTNIPKTDSTVSEQDVSRTTIAPKVESESIDQHTPEEEQNVIAATESTPGSISKIEEMPGSQSTVIPVLSKGDEKQITDSERSTVEFDDSTPSIPKDEQISVTTEAIFRKDHSDEPTDIQNVPEIFTSTATLSVEIQTQPTTVPPSEATVPTTLPTQQQKEPTVTLPVELQPQSTIIPVSEETVTTILPTLQQKEPTESILPTEITQSHKESEGAFTTATVVKFDSTETSTINIGDNEIDEETVIPPGRIPGEGDCLLDGITYRNESVVPSTNKCHTSCKCFSSIIKCDPIICSPPPEYMNNCQSVYDSPESCCPTYVCDHSKETVPPESQSQMSGTEKPVPSPSIECLGDQCEIVKEETSSPIAHQVNAIKPCEGNACDETSDIPSISDTAEAPVMPPCYGDTCDTIVDKASIPVKQCEGQDCDIKTHISELPQVSSKPCEGDSCDATSDKAPVPEAPVDSLQPCEGDNCYATSDETPILEVPKESVKPCEGDSCDATADKVPIPEVPIESVKPCDGDGCDATTDKTTTPEVLKESVKPCEGDSCDATSDKASVPEDVVENEKPCEGDSCDATADKAPVPEVPIDSLQPCEGDNCYATSEKTPTSEVPKESVKPCDGDSCDVIFDRAPIPEVPVDSLQPCERDNCDAKPDKTATPEVSKDSEKPCEGDGCGASSDKAPVPEAPMDSLKPCKGDSCDATTDNASIPEVPVESPQPCEGDNCDAKSDKPTTPEVSKESVKPCEGDGCDATSDKIPVLEAPVESVKPCEGEGCDALSDKTPISEVPAESLKPCEGDGCDATSDKAPAIPEVPLDSLRPCEGDDCNAKSDQTTTPEVSKESVKPCEGDGCDATSDKVLVPEAPVESVKPCEGEGCDALSDKPPIPEVPTDSLKPCQGDGCDATSDKAPVVPEVPVDSLQPCEGDDCNAKSDQTTTPDVSKESVKPCEGDGCDVTSDKAPVPEAPAESLKPCEGDSCDATLDQTHIPGVPKESLTPCEGDACDTTSDKASVPEVPVESLKPCEGDSCVATLDKTPIPEVAVESLKPCEGDACDTTDSTSDKVPIPDIPVDSLKPCGGDSCDEATDKAPIPEVPKESVKPCEGDSCYTTSDTAPIQQDLEESVKPCEGEHCTIADTFLESQTPQVTVKDDETCKDGNSCQKPQTLEPSCIGVSCRRQEISDTGSTVPQELSTELPQHTDDFETASTESPGIDESIDTTQDLLSNDKQTEVTKQEKEVTLTSTPSTFDSSEITKIPDEILETTKVESFEHTAEIAHPENTPEIGTTQKPLPEELPLFTETEDDQTTKVEDQGIRTEPPLYAGAKPQETKVTNLPDKDHINTEAPEQDNKKLQEASTIGINDQSLQTERPDVDDTEDYTGLHKMTEKTELITENAEESTGSSVTEIIKQTEPPIVNEYLVTQTELTPGEETTNKSPDQDLGQDTKSPEQPDQSIIEPLGSVTETDIPSETTALLDVHPSYPPLPEEHEVQDFTTERDSVITLPHEKPEETESETTKASDITQVTESNKQITESNEQNLIESDLTSPAIVDSEEVLKVQPVTETQEQSTKSPDVPDMDQEMLETESPGKSQTNTETPVLEPEVNNENKLASQEGEEPVVPEKETTVYVPDSLVTEPPVTKIPAMGSQEHDTDTREHEFPEVTGIIDTVTSLEPVFITIKPEPVSTDDESKQTESPALYSTEYAALATVAPEAVTESKIDQPSLVENEVHETDEPIYLVTEPSRDGYESLDQEPSKPVIADLESVEKLEPFITEKPLIIPDSTTVYTDSMITDAQELSTKEPSIMIPEDTSSIKQRENITENTALPESGPSEQDIPNDFQIATTLPAMHEEYATKEPITDKYEHTSKSSILMEETTPDFPELETTNTQEKETDTSEQGTTSPLEPVTEMPESSYGQAEKDTTSTTSSKIDHEINDFTESSRVTDGLPTETPQSLVTQPFDEIKGDSDTKQSETSVTDETSSQVDITTPSEIKETGAESVTNAPADLETSSKYDSSAVTKTEEDITEATPETVLVTESQTLPAESVQPNNPTTETVKNDVTTESIQTIVTEDVQQSIVTESSTTIVEDIDQSDSKITEKPLETDIGTSEQHKQTDPSIFETTEPLPEKPTSSIAIEEYEKNTESSVQFTTENQEYETTKLQDDEMLIETSTKVSEGTTVFAQKSTTLLPQTELTSDSKYETPESTPYLIELEEHTHMINEESVTTVASYEDETIKPAEQEQTITELPSNKLTTSQPEETSVKQDQSKLTVGVESSSEVYQTTLVGTEDVTDKSTLPSVSDNFSDGESDTKYGENEKPPSSIEKYKTTLSLPTSTETSSMNDSGIAVQTDLDDVKPVEPDVQFEITKPEVELSTKTPINKYTTPEDKLIETVPSTAAPEIPKPGANEIQPAEEISPPEDSGHFAPSGTSGYGQEPDYFEEDQTFGPGTCRYGGKVYVSAQQIPRDDPCDFCFCFRSDIICLQQSCPPPIHGCHEEPIQGFCCPRYECPVSMATTLNVTTTTTTTTTTLPPNFPTHSYKGAAQRRGCQIKGHTYKVGEVVRASSGPCLHCTCGGDGQMKCDPKACTPEPMLRQMIAAAVSAKRRR